MNFPAQILVFAAARRDAALSRIASGRPIHSCNQHDRASRRWSSDVIARIVGEHMSRTLGQQLVQ